MNSSSNTSAFNILVAEDNFTNQVILEKILQAAGWQVKTALNGRQALEYLAQQTFDLVLMDWQMPVMDGLTATREIRNSKAAWAQIPVIGITGNSSADERSRCLAAGMNDVMAKPVNRQQLTEMINSFLVG